LKKKNVLIEAIKREIVKVVEVSALSKYPQKIGERALEQILDVESIKDVDGASTQTKSSSPAKGISSLYL
jgi:hypothetical protein